ncbi:MAG: glycine cleavage system protein GcvH [Myxococcota bacterium]|nr:glycine cleavage system protein GcvH [Myxococcota bacterium]MDW8364029.1 glycine cleavage system protein GcvH [Myxococcales bacterium]
MKDIPDGLAYTKEHEWARREGDLVRVGITAYAVEQLGDVTLVDLPARGRHVRAGERFGDVESVKTVSELYAPCSGEVVEVNERLAAHPEIVNASPWDEGWMIVIRPTDVTELAALMDAAAYRAYLASLDH